jgi:hypothetical protein
MFGYAGYGKEGSDLEGSISGRMNAGRRFHVTYLSAATTSVEALGREATSPDPSDGE